MPIPSLEGCDREVTVGGVTMSSAASVVLEPGGVRPVLVAAGRDGRGRNCHDRSVLPPRCHRCCYCKHAHPIDLRDGSAALDPVAYRRGARSDRDTAPVAEAGRVGADRAVRGG